jgi:hypothetical protein
MEDSMRVITTFGIAFAVAAGAFAFIILTKPPISEAGPVTSIDTYAITINSKVDPGQEYDCN